MDVQEWLREAIGWERRRLGADVPSDREAAVLALLRAQDRRAHAFDDGSPDLVTGRRFANLGGNTALALCLAPRDSNLNGPDRPGEALDGWAERFLEACERLAETEMVLAHVETGFMRIVTDGRGTFDAWVATKRAPAGWRERADIDWWANWLARRHAPELRALPAERQGIGNADPGSDALYRRLADVHLRMMAYQLGYPPKAAVGTCTVQTYRDVLGWLIAEALRERDRGQPATIQSERALIARVASALATHPGAIAEAVAAFALDGENAAWHAAAPGVAAAPLVRVAPDRVVLSLRGLTSEPLFFLTRELRRRDAQAYHNTAHLREVVFRQDLYALFQDKRFVTSAGRVQIRRDAGDLRTDVDAVVFDRKTGSLGLFELKSHDPFARSTAERTRQRDNVLYANRQISGVLDWVQRYGADELLRRVDARTAKTFRVRKVYPFVLGRYLVRFNDGPEPDRRAAWGSWPQVLRLTDGKPFGAKEANPLASLFARLSKDEPRVEWPADGSPRVIALGEARIVVHPSYAAFQAGAASERGSR